MKYALIILILTTFISCKKDGKPVDNNYFAFGKAYGECGGNCATFYKIENSELYLDDMQYYTGSLAFQNITLSNSKYIQAKALQDNFPAYLTNHPNQTFGCPDCHDQGGIHIERKMSGTTQYWHIDTDTAAQPIEIRPYVQQVLNVIDSLE